MRVEIQLNILTIKRPKKVTIFLTNVHVNLPDHGN